MRIIIDQTKFEILSMMQTVRADRESWDGWHCLRIEMDLGNDADVGQIHADVALFLQSAIKERGNTAFLGGADEILIFCKSTPKEQLKEIGLQIQELIFTVSGQSSNFHVFDVCKDGDSLTEGYSWKSLETSEVREVSGGREAVFLPENRFEKSDPRPVLGSRKVLLVEDDPVTRWMVRTVLKDECLLATAQDAGKALAVYKTYKPDMVLLDINLPDADGMDVMAEIKRGDPGAWIVMFSSNDTLENIAGSLENGARGFIAKPFSRDKILHYVRECPSVH